MYVCMYVCMHACMNVCMYVCIHAWKLANWLVGDHANSGMHRYGPNIIGKKYLPSYGTCAACMDRGVPRVHSNKLVHTSNISSWHYGHQIGVTYGDMLPKLRICSETCKERITYYCCSWIDGDDPERKVCQLKNHQNKFAQILWHGMADSNQ